VVRGSLPWVRRGLSAALLLAVGFTPAEASVTPPQPCPGKCTQPGSTRWVRPLTGSYVVQGDSRGTMPAQGEPYAAIGPDVAAYGSGSTVQAFDAKTGAPRWTVQLGSAPTVSAAARTSPRPETADGEQIASVRSWPGVVTVTLSAVPGGPGTAGSGTAHRAGAGPRFPAKQAPGAQTEVVLNAGTGREIRSYPSAPFGGTVAADSRHAVVVQRDAVTSYRNASGTAAWSVPTGPAPQAWRLDGNYLYMTVGGGNLGGLAQQPATGLRRIDLRTGAQQIVRPHPAPFAGSLGAALDGIVLFSNADGVTAYNGANGRELWSLDGPDLPQGVDLVAHRFYLSEQGGLAAVDPWTGKVGAWLADSNGLYAERAGVALGMNDGTGGSAWGVDTTSQRVVWTVSTLPWPHYFVDLSGLGGSADPRSNAVIVASCGQAATGAATQLCAKPELVAINR
jgi:outer membrane protein assembly factor BamB